VRVPKDVLNELKALRLCTRVEALDLPLLRYLAMERGKPALVVWTDGHPQDYAHGALDGFQAED
jgi:hypothetical protein